MMTLPLSPCNYFSAVKTPIDKNILFARENTWPQTRIMLKNLNQDLKNIKKRLLLTREQVNLDVF